MQQVITGDDWADLGVVTGGTSFGDEQVGEDMNHRYVATLPNGERVVVDHNGAVCGDEDGLFYWAERTDVTVCTDADDPGSTEVWSDVQYGEGSIWSFATEDEAQQSLARAIEEDIRYALYYRVRKEV